MNATQLAEHGRDWSILMARYPHGRVETCVPNYGEQTLVGIFGRLILERDA